jgi:triphosphatase
VTNQPSDDTPTEVEWQFDALDLRPVERWLAALPSRPPSPELPTLTALAKPTRRLVDQYVDTEDWRLGQAGFVLRTRRRGRAVEATIKDRNPAGEGGLRQRMEVTETLPAKGLDAIGTSGPVGRRLAAVAGRRPLREVLEVRTRRQPFSLRAAGCEVAEVALDETTIVVGAGERPVQLRRVEVEVVAEWVEALGPLVDELRSATGLAPATLSKFEAGLLAAGLEIPGAPDLGSTAVHAHSSMGDIAFAVMRKHLGVLLAHEAGTRLGDDIEELHDMRVATRRLRAAFELFATALPARAQTLRSELKWLADALGAVRDLDVQLEGMDQMAEWAQGWVGTDHAAPLDHLRALLEAERDVARADLLDALDSPRWERLSAALVTMARQGPNRRLTESRIPAALAVPPLVAERHRSVMKAARRAKRTGVAEDYHRLRIRCKRLRYSLEFTSGLYANGAQRFVRKLTGLQDSLGLMHDAEVASLRLYALATGPTGTAASERPSDRAELLPPATVFVMGGVAQHLQEDSEQLRLTMDRRLSVLTGKSWDDFVGVMARARVRAETLSTTPTRPVRRAPVPATTTTVARQRAAAPSKGTNESATPQAPDGAVAPTGNVAANSGEGHSPATAPDAAEGGTEPEPPEASSSGAVSQSDPTLPAPVEQTTDTGDEVPETAVLVAPEGSGATSINGDGPPHAH